MNEKYKKIMNMPYRQSLVHPHMSRHDRAAQFAPFAALTGFGETINNASAVIDSALILSDDANDILDEKMMLLREHINEQPEITVLRYVPNEKKDGGNYLPFTGKLKKLDELNRKMIFTDETAIYYDDIYKIESEILD